jgi:hypothetical protein
MTGRQADNSPPQLTITPDGSDVPVNTLITLSFNEPVRRTDGIELDYMNVDNLVVLRKEGESGENVSFNATISTDKKIIELRPDTLLDTGTIYWVSVADQFEDYSGNRLPVFSGSSFTTGFTTRIAEPAIPLRVNVFPNPGNGIFSVSTDYQGILHTAVYSYLGARVYENRSLQGPDLQIDLTGRSPGIYLLVMQSSDGSVLFRHRLIISR